MSKLNVIYAQCPHQKSSTAQLHCTHINVGCMVQVGQHGAGKTISGNPNILGTVNPTAKFALKKGQI